MEAFEVEQKLLRAVPIHIAVERGINLRGSRGETLVSLVRAEYGAALLGESARVPSVPGSSTEYDFSATFDCLSDDATGLDDVAHKPVLLMVIEVLSKEKKQKEDKTVVLGQATVDLLLLVQGQTKYSTTVKVYPVAGSPLQNISSEADLPSLEVTVSVPEALLSAERLAKSNLLWIMVESAYAVPATWAAVGPMCNYTASLAVPISAEKEHVAVFANGTLRPASEKQTSARPKRWPVACVPAGGLPCIPGAVVRSSAYEEEDGELTHKEDWDFRKEAENEKTRVTWDMERRCYMDPGAVTNFQKKLAESQYWPVELAKIQIPMGTKAGRGKSEKVDEDSQISFHGVAYINLAPLLYPGATIVRGAYRVHPYSDAEMLEKTKQSGVVVREAARLVCSIGRSTGPSSIASPHPKPAPSRLGKEINKKASAVKAHVADNESESSFIQTAESQQYLEAQTYIVLEFRLEKPLIPKRKPEELAKRVADLIPPRPPMPRRIASAQQVVSDYHGEVARVASLVLDEFRAMFPEWSGAEGLRDGPEGHEERKRRLLYELNSSGKYYAFKEHLKQAVVKIVREKYLKTTSFEDRDELQAFLGELYIFLIDEMHVSLNKVLSTDSALFVPERLTDSVQLRNYGREAEFNGDSALAAKYFQERLARDKNNPDHWSDYGTFCLRSRDAIKAEECFRNAVALDQRHLESLIMCGVMCNKTERYDEAETLFENATCVHVSSSLAWTMLGLFYEGQGNDIRMDKAFLEAQRQSSASAMMAGMEVGESPHVQESSELPADDEAALPEGISVNLTQEESQEGIEPSRSRGSGASLLKRSPLLEPGNSKLSGVGCAADEDATVATSTGANAVPGDLNKDNDNADGRANATDGNMPIIDTEGGMGAPPGRASGVELAAVIAFGGGQAPSALPAEVGAPQITAFTPNAAPTPANSIFMETAHFLLDAGAIQLAERALAQELVSTGGQQSGCYCTALARLFMLRGEVKEAEAALRDAVRLDHQDPDSWAQLGHLCFVTGRVAEAKDHYERTLSFTRDASDAHAVLMRLASLHTQDAQFEEAKQAYLCASKLSPSCLSWLGVAIACYKLGELTEAEDALAEANFLNNSNAEVWAYLALVCLQTGRQLEAEQSYKYAVKLNLRNESLLREIHEGQRLAEFGNPSF